MSLLRPLRRYILVSVVGTIFFILLYALRVKISKDVDERFSSSPIREMNKSRDTNRQEIFKEYWRISGNINFTESSMKFIDDLRSQNKRPISLNHKYRSRFFEDNNPIETQHEFSQCRMSNCFDFSRCQSDGPIKVYIVPSWQATKDQLESAQGESNVIHRNILKVIRESKHFEPDPEKACIFIPEDDTLDRDPLSQSFIANTSNLFGPENQYGMNHLIFNLYSGSWPDYKENDFAGLNFGAAIIAKASNSITHHRPDFDISLPLFSYLHPDKNHINERDESLAQTGENRSYFFTFKGKRYVFGKGSETRNNLYHLNNKRDVLMLTTCRHGKKWRESSDARCVDDETYYDKYEFVDLMKKSTFCLTPRGRRLGSFRYLEALSYGCIPVILSDGWVKPFDEIIDWSCASIQFSERLLLQVPDMLKDLDPDTITRMRSNCLNQYNRFFSSTEKIILSTLSMIERRIQNFKSIQRINNDFKLLMNFN